MVEDDNSIGWIETERWKMIQPWLDLGGRVEDNNSLV